MLGGFSFLGQFHASVILIPCSIIQQSSKMCLEGLLVNYQISSKDVGLITAFHVLERSHRLLLSISISFYTCTLTDFPSALLWKFGVKFFYHTVVFYRKKTAVTGASWRISNSYCRFLRNFCP